MKRVLLFGIYDREYPRNRVLIQGLRENGYEVVHCNVDPRRYPGMRKYRMLAKEALSLRKADTDLVWVLFPGQTCVWLAWLLFPRKKIVFDVFLSLHEANVHDRKVYAPWSIRAVRDWLLDWYSIRLAGVVTLDTHKHIEMFHAKYGVDREKAVRIFIGSTLPPVAPLPRAEGKGCLVHFQGSFIPQHGIEYIIRAAKVLESDAQIRVRFVGGGQEYEKMRALARSLDVHNIVFTGRLPEYAQVLEALREADIVLGVFGTERRAGWVIVNKVFEGMAFGKAIITSDNDAMRELCRDRENALFVKAGNPDDLAAKIMELCRDTALRERIANGAHALYAQHLTPQKLVAGFLRDARERGLMAG